jgi:hypothetical protein
LKYTRIQELAAFMLLLDLKTIKLEFFLLFQDQCYGFGSSQEHFKYDSHILERAFI